MQLIQGEEKGLVIHLYGQHSHVTLDFGIAQAVNILDEGVQLAPPPGVCFQNQKELHQSGFPDTLYHVENGAYAAYIQACMSHELYEAMDLRQFNLVTLNYVVEIICFDEPTITVT
ncbi:MAG: hypothetical protein IJX04_06650 [Oscillospiraceae bacterium]|nr:hypothetical protein [Oscillospiraceae bacterium]